MGNPFDTLKAFDFFDRLKQAMGDPIDLHVFH